MKIHEFNIHPIEETPPLPRSTENVLVRMSIVPQYLDDVFYLPTEKRNKKTYNPRVATVARTITDEVHQKMYREKQESKAKKRKRKDRKRAREKKQEIKLNQGNNKKIRKQQGKKKESEGSTNDGRKGEKKNEENFIQEGSSQPPKKRPQRVSGLKFRQNLKQLVCDNDESSSDESDYDSSSDSEDFSDKCGVCKSKYRPFSGSIKCSSKMVDKWIPCDMCT